MPDEEKLAAVREALPAVGAGIYLNTPSAGPMPAETAKAMADVAASELTLGRAHPDQALDARERAGEARAGVAAILGTDVDFVGLIHSETDAVVLLELLAGLNARDRSAVLVDPSPAVEALVQGYGGAVMHLIPDGDNAAILRQFEAAIATGCGLVVIPHVSPSSGTVLPVAGIADLAHAKGALVAVDGSQAVGTMPFDLETLGADVYRVAAETWLLGPQGIGAVWCTSGVLDRVRVIVPGWFGTGEVDHHRPVLVGFARSCGWLSMYVGLDWIQGRGAAAARLAAARLERIPGVVLLTPTDRMATVLSFKVRGWSAEAALDELGARAFAIASTVPALDAIRIGVGFFNTEAEIERFAQAVELIAAHTPETLPPRRTLTILHAGQ
jgi:selenocysteine lyase/cysteine desulfurase